MLRTKKNKRREMSNASSQGIPVLTPPWRGGYGGRQGTTIKNIYIYIYIIEDIETKLHIYIYIYEGSVGMVPLYT